MKCGGATCIAELRRFALAGETRWQWLSSGSFRCLGAISGTGFSLFGFELCQRCKIQMQTG
jgi:hypothetical protein